MANKQKIQTSEEKVVKVLNEFGEEVVDALRFIPTKADLLTLSEFNRILIYPFDQEAEVKGWKTTKFQDVLGEIWDSNQKSCTLAPREHLKTHTVLSYILKKVFSRQYPLEINYYHINEQLASEKFRKMQRIVEKSGILAENFDLENAKSWSEEKIELSDGTTIIPLSYKAGVVGKHPHIIVLDDVIDYKVIYSDELNRKAIDKFYMDIYPQVSKDDIDKKIIIIGTAQRKDDLYHSLPKDFTFNVFRAIINEQTKEVLSPEIFSYDALMKIKSDISSQKGERYWLKEYMNEPFESLGLIIKPEWIQYYYEKPNTFGMYIYQGWDLAVGKDLEKGDWTVGATIAVDLSDEEKIRIYVLEIFRARLNFGQRLQIIKDMYDKWKPLAVGIEDVAFQYDTIQTLVKTTAIPVLGVKTIKSKIESFQVELAPYFENRQMFIGRDMEELKLELLSLPLGEYDDQADAIKIAIKTFLFAKPAGRLPGGSDDEKRKTITGGLLETTF